MAEQQTDPHVEDHASFIKTPKQLLIVVLLAFVVPITVIIMLARLMTNVANPYDTSHPAMSDEAIAQRIRPVGQVALGDPNAPPPAASAGAPAPAAAPAAPKVAQSGEQVFKQVCQACHATGVLNAPKFGDKAAWGKLIPKGLDALTAQAIKGLNQMPPRGGNPSLSDVEISRAIVYMANQAGATWKEPETVAAK